MQQTLSTYERGKMVIKECRLTHSDTKRNQNWGEKIKQANKEVRIAENQQLTETIQNPPFPTPSIASAMSSPIFLTPLAAVPTYKKNKIKKIKISLMVFI